MANKYEFNIEEINTVIITMKTDSRYTTTYNRKYDEDGNPTREFVVTYSAEPDESEDGKITVICGRCEKWHTFDKEEYYSDGFEFKCECNNDYEEVVDENDLINVIETIMDEDTFFDNNLLINYIPIV